jgi:hypothetical protein
MHLTTSSACCFRSCRSHTRACGSGRARALLEAPWALRTEEDRGLRTAPLAPAGWALRCSLTNGKATARQDCALHRRQGNANRIALPHANN